MHNLVQYLLSQPHFLGCLHGRQLGRPQLRHYPHAGKPPRAHTERRLPNTRSPRGAPAVGDPSPAAGTLPGPQLRARLHPDAADNHSNGSSNSTGWGKSLLQGRPSSGTHRERGKEGKDLRAVQAPGMQRPDVARCGHAPAPRSVRTWEAFK